MPLKSQSGFNDCCRDEYKYVKDDKDQTPSDNFAALAQSKLLFASIYAQPVFLSLSSAFPAVKGLPAKVVKRSYSYPPLNQINCNFRI